MSIANLYQRFGTSNMVLPKEGPVVVPVVLDFTSSASVIADLSALVQQEFLSSIQGVFVDNADNANKLYINIAGTNQRLLVPANSQLFAPLFVPTVPTFTCTTTAGIVVQAIFYNIPVSPILIK